jgi:hypothetical protein
MARVVNKLSARAVATLKVSRRHSGEGGIHLSISPDGSRRGWVFPFRWKAPGGKSAGKLREMGLGSANTISLAQARDRSPSMRSRLNVSFQPSEKWLTSANSELGEVN